MQDGIRLCTTMSCTCVRACGWGALLRFGFDYGRLADKSPFPEVECSGDSHDVSRFLSRQENETDTARFTQSKWRFAKKHHAVPPTRRCVLLRKAWTPIPIMDRAFAVACSGRI
jgi:hypothetical protein